MRRTPASVRRSPSGGSGCCCASIHQGFGTALSPRNLQADIVAEVRPALLALAFAVAFLLLVLTVNLASLLLARAVERERELAMSRALGANSAAIIRATLLEGAALGLAGGIAGVVLAAWGTKLLVALGLDTLPRRDAIEMDAGIGLLVVVLGALLGTAAAAAPGSWGRNDDEKRKGRPAGSA